MTTDPCPWPSPLKTYPTHSAHSGSSTEGQGRPGRDLKCVGRMMRLTGERHAFILPADSSPDTQHHVLLCLEGNSALLQRKCMAKPGKEKPFL